MARSARLVAWSLVTLVVACGGSPPQGDAATNDAARADAAPNDAAMTDAATSDGGPLPRCDFDHDGYASTACGGHDCDDDHADVHPGAAEDCDSFDQDCDGRVDEGAMRPFYVDADGDGAAGATYSLACTGTFDSATDCDDTDPSVHPGAVDAAPGTCNGRDDDCNGVVDDGCACASPATETCGPLDPADPSGTTFIARGACHTGTQSCGGSRWDACVGAVYPRDEVCTAFGGVGGDEDCDGRVDEGDAFGLCTCGSYVGGWDPMTVTVTAGAPSLGLGIQLTLVEGVAATSTTPASAIVELACPATTQSLGTVHLDTSAPAFSDALAPNVCGVEITLVEADATHAVLTFRFFVCG